MSSWAVTWALSADVDLEAKVVLVALASGASSHNDVLANPSGLATFLHIPLAKAADALSRLEEAGLLVRRLAHSGTRYTLAVPSLTQVVADATDPSPDFPGGA